VLSLPDINSLILVEFISKPTTGYLVANNLASGRPTYPRPIIAILANNNVPVIF